MIRRDVVWNLIYGCIFVIGFIFYFFQVECVDFRLFVTFSSGMCVISRVDRPLMNRMKTHYPKLKFYFVHLFIEIG